MIEHRKPTATGTSTGAPSMTATLSTAAAGVTGILRIRDTNTAPSAWKVRSSGAWVTATRKVRSGGVWV